MKKIAYLIFLQMLLFFSVNFSVYAKEKQTIYNSPYVSFSPDGKAFTTNAGDTNYTWYPARTTVSTGIDPSIRKLNTGEHYYRAERTGEVPVGYWKVMHRPSQCIHSGYPTEGYYHGIEFRRKKCLRNYYSGWMAYCADCGERITDMYLYMSREAAESIDYMDLGNGKDFAYYYLCPHCTNLEQGSNLKNHMCRAISWNQYTVQYDANTKGPYGGYVADSTHMYNNADVYEGEHVIPVTHLTKNSYTRIGYEFTGWNSKADGTGTSYRDGEEIFNLTSENREGGVDGRGIVTLYAQWKVSQSSLVIDPNGGTYGNRSTKTQISKNYNSEYTLGTEKVSAPKGNKVNFESNGGNAVASITGSQHFVEWKMSQPFYGRIYNQGTPKEWYLFCAPDGSVDTLTAMYEPDSVTLPKAVREGYSFGGWYYDNEFTEPAGGAGDIITPSKDLTLYAQWVDLKLTAENNYAANDGKGSVDLSWSQSDGRNKTYRIYQSRDALHWRKVKDAADIGNSLSIKENYAHNGSQQTYTVPYTGLYVLTARGAQGGSYGSYAGGEGGSVDASFWLSKGEVLTCNVGSCTGYNGGGKADSYGNGGGMTTVRSNLKGNLLTAGGGGGASPAGNGGAGGSTAGVIQGSRGQNGMAGGGAGHQGGSAGERIVHQHTDTCYYREDQSYSLLESAWMRSYQNYGAAAGVPGGPAVSFGGNSYNNSYNVTGGGCRTSGPCTFRYWFGQYFNTGYSPVKPYWSKGCIPANENTAVDIGVRFHCWGDGTMHPENSRIIVYNQNGTPIYTNTLKPRVSYVYRHNSGHQYVLTETVKNPGGIMGLSGVHYTRESWQDGSGFHGTPAVNTLSGTVRIPLPAGTESISVYLSMDYDAGVWTENSVESVKFSGGICERVICGYLDGQVLSSKPAYGGSNYVNTDYAYQFSSRAGQQRGDGTVSIRSESVGFVDALQLAGVTATDYSPPCPIDAVSVAIEPMNKAGAESAVVNRAGVKVSWEEPQDRGTDYYHYVESCLTGSVNPLCRSNIVKNTLTSGIWGYYIVADSEAATMVNAGNGNFQRERQFMVTSAEASGSRRYLHVAAVDVAGNISETLHISVGRDDVAWNLYTRQLEIGEGENVYLAKDAKSYYVRSDGRTPFLLRLYGYMDGPASEEYQPGFTIYETLTDGKSAKTIIETPSAKIMDGTIRVEAEGLIHSTEGEPALVLYPYSYTERSCQNREIQSVQKFTLKQDISGKAIEVNPVIGAVRKKKIVYSDHNRDKENGILIIADGEAPVIRGLELLENTDLINRMDGSVNLAVTAADELSGVRELYVKITNTDNAIEMKYLPDEEGVIRIELTKDEPVFSGDFYVTAYAADNVGNKREIAFGTTEFELSAGVERILEPHDPVFKAGESGILTIATYGYAERVEVEFPKELVCLDPGLNRVFDYTDEAAYVKEEKIRFMIPIGAVSNQEYTITVRAYKGDRKLEKHPSLSTITVEGSILEELRTRLR